MNDDDRDLLIKNYYTGSFEDLSQIVTYLPINKGNSEVSHYLRFIFDIYKDIPKHIKDIARWDIKGKEMCTDLSQILFTSVLCSNGIPNLDIFDIDMRVHLDKSYHAGLKLSESLLNGLIDVNALDENSLTTLLPENLNNKSLDKDEKVLLLKNIKSEEIAKKCLIWDYVAGMTDKYIINEYESLSFKKVELH